MEILKNIIREATAIHRHLSSAVKSIPISSSSSHATNSAARDDCDESGASTTSESSHLHISTGFDGESQRKSAAPQFDKVSGGHPSPTASVPGFRTPEGYMRGGTLQSKARVVRTQTVIVTGPAGMGKTALISAQQTTWRSVGLWGQSKFVESSSSFLSILTCLSSVLRQLMAYPADVHLFVTALRARLGPQLRNVPLLYTGASELKDILNLYDLSPGPVQESLAATELRARFQLLVEAVLGVLAEIKQLALFLDDLQFADEASWDLLEALASAKGKMLLLISVRCDNPELKQRLEKSFSSRSRTTWIKLEPLNHNAISHIVTKTLHRSKEDCIPLSRLCHRLSRGNPFTVRNLLGSFRRQGLIYFDSSLNYWKFNMDGINSGLIQDDEIADPNNNSYLLQQLKELPDAARSFIVWGSLLGSTFRMAEVISMINWDDSITEGSDHEDAAGVKTKTHMKGMHAAMAEGWIVQRARDKCSFAHDRYRQTVVSYRENLPELVQHRMSLTVVGVLLRDSPTEIMRIAEYCRRSICLLHGHSRRVELLNKVLEAAYCASARGAHEQALEFFLTAKELSGVDAWSSDHASTLNMMLRIAELFTWKGNTRGSSDILDEILNHVTRSEERAQALRLRSQNHFAMKHFGASLEDILLALRELGIAIDSKVSRQEADTLFDIVKNQVLQLGFEAILAIPKTTDQRAHLAVQLLDDAGTAAYWRTGEGFADVIGLATIQESIRCGMCPGSALGFLWTLSASAERRELYRFSIDLGKLGLRIAELHGTSKDQSRVHLLYTALISGYENLHLRTQLGRLDVALQLAHSAGDRLYAMFSLLHRVTLKFWCCEHLSELLPHAEEVANDVQSWLPDGEVSFLMQGILGCIRAVSGMTIATRATNVYDTVSFSESELLHSIHTKAGNVAMTMNWYNSFKTAALYLLGWFQEASKLGFEVYESRQCHPNHRHTRFGLFFHSLAMIQCLRETSIDMDDVQKTKYAEQVDLNQQFLRRWLSSSPINNSTWVAIIEAEWAALCQKPESFKLYDTAVTLAINNDWLMEECIALYLEGTHFVQNGIKSLGAELQRRAVTKAAQWGAFGIVNSFSAACKLSDTKILKRDIFTTEVAVQTDHARLLPPWITPSDDPKDLMKLDAEDEFACLRTEDLASILRWNHTISSDINLTSSLQRMTEVAASITAAQFCCLTLREESSDFTVATTLIPPAPCQVFENPRSIQTIVDPLRKSVIQHCLATKSRLYLPDAHQEPLFATEAPLSSDRSAICVPILANRNHLQGILYIGRSCAFTANDATLLSLLAQQASVSIANGLLFKSVQQATKANLKMISSQQAALEDARKSREDALKATKTKSNFLASMSHELRTPFSSFYGLLDLLHGTSLNPGQQEIVQTAKQSCELLLKIIDSILDYSKLEAEALRIELNPFLLEDVIADCLELLLPTAVKKIDMSFNIEPNVPRWIVADYARIRQILMNMLGNGLKFTTEGSVHVVASLDSCVPCGPGEVSLKFVIGDTGIGLSSTEMDSLFVPFQQADNSSTRRFGGTGLGLSISRELIKLMKGEIGVESQLGSGSSFWFCIPVQVHNSPESQKAASKLEDLRKKLVRLRVFVSSPSPVTLSLLKSMLLGLEASLFGSEEKLRDAIRQAATQNKAVDFVIVDSQTETSVDEAAQLLSQFDTFHDCKIVHLYTPTPTLIPKDPNWGGTSSRVVKSHKPPRTSRLLHLLASLRGISSDKETIARYMDLYQGDGDRSVAKRTLYGNVLVAEDNLVAQQLLVKQLERYQLNVITADNGEEAVAEWERCEPGFFSVALFDHHMPVCDGVGACKLIRSLEARREITKPLPIIALSADCQPSVQQLCLSAGMNQFLTKPLKKEDLIALLSMF